MPAKDGIKIQVRASESPGDNVKSPPRPDPSPRKPVIVCAIPCFNTENYIGRVVSQARKYADKVIVVDDGSLDRTAEVAGAAGALVTSHPRKTGAGGATSTCFAEARRLHADILVTVDGDGQHDPAQIPQLLEPVIRQRADIAVGSRFLGKKNGIPLYRAIGILIINLLYNFGSNIKISDTQSCFRAYGKRALYSLDITEKGFGFSVQVLIEARRRHLTIVETPISCIYHSESHSLNPIVHGISVATAVLRLRLNPYRRKNGRPGSVRTGLPVP